MYIDVKTLILVQVDRNGLSIEDLLKLIPEGYMPRPHQVGGHGHVDGQLGNQWTCESHGEWMTDGEREQREEGDSV